MDTETYIDRMNKEHYELNDKIVKLKKALKQALVPSEAVPLLEAQMNAMKAYESILIIRISVSN